MVLPVLPLLLLVSMAALWSLLMMTTLLTSTTSYILFVESFVVRQPNLSSLCSSSLHHHRYHYHPSLSLSSLSSPLLKKKTSSRLLLFSTKTTTISASRRDNNNNNNADDFEVLLNKHLESMLKKKNYSNQDLLRTRIKDLKSLNRTIVRPSTIASPNAGVGLFATVDCPKGTILTCYPGDALIIFSDNDDTTTLWGSHVPQKYQQQSYINSEYMLRAVSDDWGIVALPILDHGFEREREQQNHDDDTYDDTTIATTTTATTTNASYLGHYANDGITIPPTCESDLSRYVLESNSKSNAIHQPIQNCHMVTVATKFIQKGQEIFVTYGPEYWMEQPTFGTTTKTTSKLTTTSSSKRTGKGFG